MNPGHISPSCPPPQNPKTLYKEEKYISTFKFPKKDINLSNIDSYEKSIEYLKFISEEIKKIENFVENYPEYSILGYWNSSTPPEAKKMQEAINFETVLNPTILDKLETIIYFYPRSQYFSALAIKNLAVYAKNLDYYSDHSCERDANNAYLIDNYDFTKINRDNSSLLFEKSNSILLNALRSNDIFDYQKYLILRELYFDETKLTISKSNYRLKRDVPFPILFENYIHQLNEESEALELPLRTIIGEIINE